MWFIPLGLLLIGGYWYYKSKQLTPDQAAALASSAMQNSNNPRELSELSITLRKQGYTTLADQLLIKANAINIALQMVGKPPVPLAT